MATPALGPVAASIAGDVANDAVSAVAAFFGDFVSAFVRWAMDGVSHAMAATTDLDLASWFRGPWSSMMAVAGVLAVPLFLAGVAQVLVRGEGAPGMVRLLGRLGAAVAGTMVALAGVRLVLALVDYACAAVERAAGGSVNGVVGHLGEALSASASTGGGGGPLVLAIVAGVAAFVLWLELAVRSALLALAVVFLPLALAGLLWPATAGWLRRMGEVVGAIAASKLVIVVALALAAGALGAKLQASTLGVDAADLVLGTAFLILATLGLPVALRLVPAAVAAAEVSARGSPFVVRGGLLATEVSSRRALTRKLGGSASGRGLSGGPVGAGASGSGTAGGAAAGAAGAAAAGASVVGGRAVTAGKQSAGAMAQPRGTEATAPPVSPGSQASTTRSAQPAPGTPPPATPRRQKELP